jgi:hypothetical protein
MINGQNSEVNIEVSSNHKIVEKNERIRPFLALRSMETRAENRSSMSTGKVKNR